MNYTRDCRLCPLWQLSKPEDVCAPGTGPLDSEYLFIDSASEEGQDLFDEGLKEAGLNRDAIRIERALRCSPPPQHKMTPEELAACFTYTQAVMREMPNLKHVVPMGKTAWAQFGIKGTIESKAGIPTVMEIDDAEVQGAVGGAILHLGGQ